MNTPTADTRVSDFGLALAFMRLRPGQELELALTFQYEKVAWFKTFGSFDLLAISEYTDARDVAPPISHPSITHLSSVFCFGWDKYSVGIKDDLFRSGILGVFFLKIRENILHSQGLVAEIAANSELYRRLSLSNTVKYSIYGSLGWNESILLVGTDNIEDLFKVALDVRQITEDDVFKNESSDVVHLTTFTIPTVNYRHIQNIEDCSVSELKGMILPFVSISCRPGSEDDALSLLRRDEYFPENQYSIRPMLGKPDLLVEVSQRREASISEAKGINFGDFTDRLLKFRKAAANNLSGSVMATCTYLTPDTPGSPDEPKTRVSLSEELQLVSRDQGFEIVPEPPLLELFRQPSNLLQNLHLYSTLLRMFPLYNSCVSNHFLQSTFQDMGGFVKAVLADLTEIYWNPPRIHEDAIRWTKKLVDGAKLWEVGFVQRYAGSYDTVCETLDTPLNYLGGVQRVLSAATSVARSHSSSFWNDPEEQWAGFIVFGHSFKYERRNYGIFNVPPEALLDPFDWWKLSHEIGHEVTRSLLEAPEVRRIIAEHPTSQNPACVSIVRDLVWEIAADLYDYVYGFGGEWEMFLSTVWRFLDQYLYLEGDKYTHFGRTLLVHVLHKGLDPSKLCEKDWLNEASLLKREMLALGVGAVDIDYREIVCRDDGRPGIESYSRFLPSICDALGWKPGAKSSPISTIEASFWRVLCTGSIPVDGLLSPREVLRQANTIHAGQMEINSQELDLFRTRIAAILAFWHINKTNKDT